jgi:hypothetical protein
VRAADIPPTIWHEPEFQLEAQLEASIEQARTRTPPPRFTDPAPAPTIIRTKNTNAAETLQNSTLAQLVSGCGIAAIDGYIAIRDYAAEKGVDLRDVKDRGIDLQDLISTLLINLAKAGEQGGQRKWKS